MSEPVENLIMLYLFLQLFGTLTVCSVVVDWDDVPGWTGVPP